MNEDEIEILKEKMSTKICKLTRVVYLLNNKYLESEGLILSIKDAYETENQNIIREANLKCVQLKKKIEKLNEKVEQNLEEIKSKYNEEYSSLATKYDKHKTETAKYILDIKNQHQNKISELLGQLNQIIKVSNEKINKLNEKYNKEVTSLKEGNENMVKEIEKLNEKSNKNISEIKASNQKLIEQKDKIINEKNEEIKNKENVIDKLKKEKESLINENNTKINEVNQSLENKQKLIEENKNIIENKNKEIEAYKQQLEELKNKYNTIQNELKSNGDKDTEIQLKNKTISELETKLNISEKNIKDINEKFNQTLAQNKNYKILIDDNENKKIQYETKIKELLQVKTDNLTTINNLTKEVENKTNEIQKILKENTNEISALKKEKNDLQQKIEDINNKHVSEGKLKEELDRLNFTHTLEMNELKIKYDAQISALKIENIQLKSNGNKSNEYESIILDLKKKLENVKEKNDKKEFEFKKIQNEIFKKMKNDFVEAINGLQNKNSLLKKEILEMEYFIHNRKSKEEDLKKIAILQNELKTKNEELADIKEYLAEINNGKDNNYNKKSILFNSVKINSKPKYTNANYGMIFSKK